MPAPASDPATLTSDSRRFTASAEDAGRRLDLYLASRLPELSRTRIQELIDQGHVRVSERLPRRAHRLAAGEVVEIAVRPRPPLRATAEDIPLDLIYEDDDFVVVNKPAGMVVHAGAGATRGTMVNALLHRLRELSGGGDALRPGIVHRLDRGTSGAIVVARNDAAHQSLSDQFKARTVHKVYIALLHGRLARDEGSIALPIARDPRRRTRMSARQRDGRAAQTDWQVLLRLGNFTLVVAQPRTGRTHQIRAHFTATGHPLVGDTLYGAPERARAGRILLPQLGRVFLHAAKLEFAHPHNGESISVKAPLDRGLRAYLADLADAVEMERSKVDVALRGYL
jgi:23S rRNA pseudouridine1911/1915/1917 synthase